MKGQIFKKITTTAVTAAIIAAALTANIADTVHVCAEEVSSGDAGYQIDAGEIPAEEEISEEAEDILDDVAPADETPADVSADQALPDADVAPASVPSDETIPDVIETPEESEDQEAPIESEAIPVPAVLNAPAEVSKVTVSGTAANKPVYDGMAHEVTVTLAGEGTGEDGTPYDVSGANGQATVTVTATHVADNQFVIEDPSAKGIIVREQGGTTEVNPSVLEVDAEVIEKAEIIATSMDLLKTYDGSPLENGETPLAEDSGWADGEGAVYTFKGSLTEVGTGINEFTATSGKNGTDLNDYRFTYTYGSIRVIDRPEDQKYIITVEGNSTSTKYNGKEQSIKGYVLEGRSDSEFRVKGSGDASEVHTVTIGNSTFTVTGLAASAKGTGAGTYAVNITGSPVIRDAEGANVTNQFKFEFKPGQFEIEKRHVVFTSASLKKKYSGKAIKKHKVTVSGDGFAEGEGATYKFTGKQKEVGESYNYFTYKLNAGTLAENYEIEKVPGILKVKKNDTAINETPHTYDNNDENVEGNQESQQPQQSQQQASQPVQTVQPTPEPEPAEEDVSEALPEEAQTAEGLPDEEDPSVLGAKRAAVTVDIKNPKNVLGARRSGTEDDIHMERHIFAFAAAVLFMAAIKIKRNKRIKK